MILPTYYVKEMYVRFKDSPNRHLEFSMTKAVGALEPRRHQQWGSLSGKSIRIIYIFLKRSKHSSKASPQETKRQRSSQSLASNKFKSPLRQRLKFGQNPPQAAKKLKLLRQLQILGYPKLFKLQAC